MAAPQQILDAQKLIDDYLASIAAPKPIPPAPPDTVSLPYGVAMTLCTIFALEWDGKTPDLGDNGKGAWGADTRNPALVGCALPIILLKDTLGGLSVDHIKGFQVQVYSQVTQKEVMADIVDEGPAAWTHRLLDGTWGLHKALGHIDYGLANYGDNYSKWPAGFHVAYWVSDPNGKSVAIKGVDFKNAKIIGS